MPNAQVSVPSQLLVGDQRATFLPPAAKLGQGHIFRSVCQEFRPRGGACIAGGHAWQGACMAGGGAHAWQEGVHGGGACVADTTRYGQ